MRDRGDRPRLQLTTIRPMCPHTLLDIGKTQAIGPADGKTGFASDPREAFDQNRLYVVFEISTGKDDRGLHPSFDCVEQLRFDALVSGCQDYQLGCFGQLGERRVTRTSKRGRARSSNYHRTDQNDKERSTKCPPPTGERLKEIDER